MKAQQQPTLFWQFLKRNWLNGLFIAFILLMAFNPNVKAYVIRAFMQVGLFKPDVNGRHDNYLPAPDAVFIDKNDTAIALSALKGHVVFLNFWASWCAPCIAEMPGINALHEQFAGNKAVVFIMVDADGALTTSATFLQNHYYSLPLYKAADNLHADLFTGTLPTTVIINKKGDIVFKETGAANYSTKQVTDFLQKLSAE